MKLLNIISFLILTINLLPAQTYECIYYEYYSNWVLTTSPIKPELTKISESLTHSHKWIYDKYDYEDRCREKICGEKYEREEQRICSLCSTITSRTKHYGFSKSNKNSLFLYYFNLYYLE